PILTTPESSRNAPRSSVRLDTPARVATTSDGATTLPLSADRRGPTNGTSMVSAGRRPARWRCCGDPSSGGRDTGPGDKSFPGPARDLQTVWHIVRRPVVAGHRRRGRPREVVVQHFAYSVAAGHADVCQPLVETRDRSTVHLLVGTVTAVNP